MSEIITLGTVKIELTPEIMRRTHEARLETLQCIAREAKYSPDLRRHEDVERWRRHLGTLAGMLQTTGTTAALIAAHEAAQAEARKAAEINNRAIGTGTPADQFAEIAAEAERACTAANHIGRALKAALKADALAVSLGESI